MGARAPLSREIACAAQAIAALAGGRSLQPAIEAAIAAGGEAGEALDPASRAAIRDIAYHACRQLGLARELARLLDQRPPPLPLAALQWVALAQLLEPLRAEAVIVDQAVAAARLVPGASAAAGFLNATLRRFLRERDALLAAARRKDEARWNYPHWWIAQLRAEQPRAWRAILEAGNAPVVLGRKHPDDLRVHEPDREPPRTREPNHARVRASRRSRLRRARAHDRAAGG